MPRGRGPSASANRTDLLSPAPVTTVGGQTYGDQAAQMQAQRTIPMANGPVMPTAQAPQSPGAPTPPGGAPGDLLQQTLAHNGPGDMTLTRPTERPNEPVTHGLPVGAGAGPEALQGIGAASRNSAIEGGTLSTLLASMAAQPTATSAIQFLAGRAASGSL